MAYRANAVVLAATWDFIGVDPHLSRLTGATTYSTLAFAGLKVFVFGAEQARRIEQPDGNRDEWHLRQGFGSGDADAGFWSASIAGDGA